MFCHSPFLGLSRFCRLHPPIFEHIRRPLFTGLRMVIPTVADNDSFDGAKSVQPGRRGAQRDVVHRASAATHQMDGFGPPKAGFSRPLDVVMLHLWSTRPRRQACLASSGLWYNTFVGQPVRAHCDRRRVHIKDRLTLFDRNPAPGTIVPGCMCAVG